LHRQTDFQFRVIVACSLRSAEFEPARGNNSTRPSTPRFTANSMIATAPANARAAEPRLEFEQLLLGDLRELLGDAAGRQRDRWLLATLDMLLVLRPRPESLYLQVLPRTHDLASNGSTLPELPVPFERLQRLRDKIAHHAPYEPLAQELIADLRAYFEAVRARTRTMPALR
jgi:hypothetical protein